MFCDGNLRHSDHLACDVQQGNRRRTLGIGLGEAVPIRVRPLEDELLAVDADRITIRIDPMLRIDRPEPCRHDALAECRHLLRRRSEMGDCYARSSFPEVGAPSIDDDGPPENSTIIPLINPNNNLPQVYAADCE